MTNLDTLQQLLLLSTAISSFFTFLITVIYLLITSRPQPSKREEQAYEKAMQVLEDARATSANLIKKGHIKAWQILESADVFNKELRKDFESSVDDLSHRHLSSLKTVSTDLLDKYKQAVNLETEEGQKSITNLSNELQEEVVKELEAFKKTLAEKTIQTENLVDEKVQQEYLQMKTEIEEYKASQMKKIDDNVYEIANKAVISILGHAVNLNEQQNIVLECLEEAKKQGMFN